MPNPRPRSARPAGPSPEPLEGRQMLSALSAWLNQAVKDLGNGAKNSIVSLERSTGLTGAPTVAVAGDGLSQSYAGEFSARSWTEILLAKGELEMGHYAQKARTDGFALNWATDGATTSTLVDQQLPGLLSQLKSGDVDYVVVTAGTADFAQFLNTQAQALVTQGQAGDFANALELVADDVDSNLDEFVREVRKADPNVRVLVATIPKVTGFPGNVPDWATSSPKGQQALKQVDRAVAELNAEIRATNRIRGRTAVVDLARQLDPRLQGRGRLALEYDSVDLSARGTDYHDFFLPDGTHLGTVGQALVANGVVNAINSQHADRLKPIGRTQILAMASLVDSTASDV